MTRSRTAQTYIEEFKEIVGAAPRLDGAFAEAFEALVAYLAGKRVRPLSVRRREFIAHTNWKFRINAEGIAKFYASAAARGVTFHYHFKKDIERAFDLSDRQLLVATLEARGVAEQDQRALLSDFEPKPESCTLECIRSECAAPSKLREYSKLRKEVGAKEVDQEILRALFAAFIWTSLPQREMHAHFDPVFNEEHYRESFWDELHQRTPKLFNRQNALHVIRLPAELTAKVGAANASSILCNAIGRVYEQVNNYGFAAVLIEHVDGERADEWLVAARASLFAEKYRELPLERAYFRWQTVREETLACVPVADEERAAFHLVNEGFTYRDCFVIAEEGHRVRSLLLVFQKNERDETVVPCPACRSTDVQGNSYPTLGVRSWECNNPLCPERSKYNRGKRYSFKGLVMQQAIENPADEVPIASVRAWSRDVVSDVSTRDIADMLLRHFSMTGDVVHVHGWNDFGASRLGRKVHHHQLESDEKPHAFWSGPFFERFAHRARREKNGGSVQRIGQLTLHQGDAGEVLRTFRANSIDGAVTSPPYYNAREYAQWSNMYCHLHEMFDINAEVFRVLKPGGMYLYNVFDYFDNERTIVFSAMGQKRVLLSAYTVELFTRIGYELVGCVVWDKGEIEGKRGFNGGNFSPYYQAPFNCWEHVLAFRKPDRKQASGISRVIRQKPVIKMVRGQNTHGHSAPFPERIPELLLETLPKGATVLEPFAGSLTTARAALRRGMKAVCIERSAEYCELGLRMLGGHEPEQLRLFPHEVRAS